MSSERPLEPELIWAALLALKVAKADGEAKYPDYHWREPEEGIEHQLERAELHLMAAHMKARGADLGAGAPDDDLAHAIARLVIAYTRREAGLP